MRQMPALGTKCVNSFEQSLTIASATETLWLTAPPRSAVRKQLRQPQLEALYEATFLRVFSIYEAFIEDALAHYMSNYGTADYAPIPSAPQRLHRTVSSAVTALYDGRPYLLWHNAEASIARAKKHLENSPIEVALTGNKSQLDHYARIRHHIAHNSRDSRNKFLTAATSLTGNDHGGVPGKLLRAADISDPLNQPKWIRVIVDDMASTALQICP